MNKIRKFLNTPKEGDTVRIYLDNKGLASGIVKAVVVRVRSFKEYVKSEIVVRHVKMEVAIVERTEEIISAYDAKYCLDERRIEFIK